MLSTCSTYTDFESLETILALLDFLVQYSDKIFHGQYLVVDDDETPLYRWNMDLLFSWKHMDDNNNKIRTVEATVIIVSWSWSDP